MNPEDFEIRGGVIRLHDRNWQFVYWKDMIVSVWLDGHYIPRAEAELVCRAIKDKEHADKFQKKGGK